MHVMLEIERKVIMKRKKLLIGLGLAITLVAGMGLALGGGVTASKELKDSDTSSYSQEQKAAIKKAIRKSREDWKARRKREVLDFVAPNGKIMFGQDQEILSKKEFGDRLPAAFDGVEMTLESIKVVAIDGQSAKVETVESFYPQGNIRISLFKTIDLIYDKGKDRWLLQRSVYSIERE